MAVNERFQEDAAAGPKTALAKTKRRFFICFAVLRKTGETSGKERESVTTQTEKSCSGTDNPNIVLAKLRFKIISYKQLSSIKAAKAAMKTKGKSKMGIPVPEKAEIIYFKKLPLSLSSEKKSLTAYADKLS